MSWGTEVGVSYPIQTEITSTFGGVYLGHSDPLARKFKKLSAQWLRDTMDISSLSKVVSDPAYLQIIALGEGAIPLILDELIKAPDHWFVALEALTGVMDVVPLEDAGDIEAMARAWLDWGRNSGYI